MKNKYIFVAGILLFFLVWEWMGKWANTDTLVPMMSKLISEKDLAAIIPKTSFRWGGTITYSDQPYHFFVFVMRKCMHLISYGVLSIFIWYCVHHFTSMSNRKKLICISALILITAMADEWIQSFSPLRGPSFNDIVLDTAGMLLTYGALWLVRGCKLW